MMSLPHSFKQTLSSRGYRGQTCALYRKYAGALLEYFRVPAEDLMPCDVLDWVGYAQSELAWKPRTINVALASFRLLFEAIGRPEVMAPVRSLRVDHPEPTVLSASEVGQLLAAATTLTMRAAIALLYGAGLRISEMLALRFADVDSRRGVLIVGPSKNRHGRHALLPARGLVMVRALWVMRRELGPVALHDPIFVSRTGDVLRRNTVGEALVRCAERARLSKRVYPHLLRHSFATSMIEMGVDVTTVQRLLGHRSLSSTARYVHLTAATRAGLKSPVDALLGRPAT